MTRDQLKHEFLNQHGWGHATRIPVAGDASKRSYERLLFQGKTRVFMDAPPEHESVIEFIEVDRYLDSIGLHAVHDRHTVVDHENTSQTEPAPVIEI